MNNLPISVTIGRGGVYDLLAGMPSKESDNISTADVEQIPYFLEQSVHVFKLAYYFDGADAFLSPVGE